VKGTAKLSMVSEEIQKWDGDANCPCCSRPWKEHTDKVKEVEARISEKKAIAGKLTKLAQKIKIAQHAAEKIKLSEIEIEKYTGRIKNLENSTEIYRLKLESVENELVSITDSLSVKNHEKDQLEDKIKGMDEIVKNSRYEEARALLKTKVQDRREVLESKNDNIYLVGGLTQKVESLAGENIEKEELLEKLAVVTRESTVYSALTSSFGRTGIQAVIIDNVIEELTAVVNEWLNKFCYEPTYIKFVTQKMDSKGGWKETLDIQVITPSGESEFEGLSGGEAFRVAFAIRLGLSQIQTRRMGGETQLLMLDEVSTSLDKHGLATFVSIIRQLEKKMKVLVITHDDNLKEEFEHIFTVKKTDQNSALTAN